MIDELEAALVRAFVLGERCARVLHQLTNPKRRQKFVAELPHFERFDSRWIVTIPANQQNADGIERILLRKGAPTDCYVLSVNASIDRRTMSLRTSLDLVVCREPGTILSCISGRLAYYEGEQPGNRYVLERRDSDGRPREC